MQEAGSFQSDRKAKGGSAQARFLGTFARRAECGIAPLRHWAAERGEVDPESNKFLVSACRLTCFSK